MVEAERKAILSGVDDGARTPLTDLDAVADAEWFDRSRTLVLHGPGYERPAPREPSASDRPRAS